jgi:hypothetical protein
MKSKSLKLNKTLMSTSPIEAISNMLSHCHHNESFNTIESLTFYLYLPTTIPDVISFLCKGITSFKGYISQHFSLDQVLVISDQFCDNAECRTKHREYDISQHCSVVSAKQTSIEPTLLKDKLCDLIYKNCNISEISKLNVIYVSTILKQIEMQCITSLEWHFRRALPLIKELEGIYVVSNIENSTRKYTEFAILSIEDYKSYKKCLLKVRHNKV